MSDPEGREGPGRHSGALVSVPGEGWPGVQHFRAGLGRFGITRLGVGVWGSVSVSREGTEVPFSTTLARGMNEESG